jgi:hypothetical protein
MSGSPPVEEVKCLGSQLQVNLSWASIEEEIPVSVRY